MWSGDARYIGTPMAVVSLRSFRSVFHLTFTSISSVSYLTFTSVGSVSRLTFASAV